MIVQWSVNSLIDYKVPLHISFAIVSALLFAYKWIVDTIHHWITIVRRHQYTCIERYYSSLFLAIWNKLKIKALDLFCVSIYYLLRSYVFCGTPSYISDVSSSSLLLFIKVFCLLRKTFLLRYSVSCGRPSYHSDVSSSSLLLRSSVSCGRPSYYSTVFSSLLLLLRSSVSCGRPSYYCDVSSSSLFLLGLFDGKDLLLFCF